MTSPSQSTQEVSEHTPVPWRVSSFEQGLGGSGRVIMGGDDFSVAHVMDRDPEENEVDAAFIVTAVNSHAALLARNAELERALREIAQDCYNDGGPTEPAKIASAALYALKAGGGA